MSCGQAEQRAADAEQQTVSYYFPKQLVQSSSSGWATIGGDCPLLRDYLAEKKGVVGWEAVGILVSFLRGFSQTVFSNNPITGIIIIVTLALIAPGTLVACSATGFLGHLISMLIREPTLNVNNGLTVFNPLIFGSVSYYFVPVVYGQFDSFSLLMLFLGVIFIAYSWRACGNGSIPCLTMPFNVAELLLLFTLKHAREQRVGLIFERMIMDNVNNTSSAEMLAITTTATTTTTAPEPSHAVENATAVIDSLDWGMVVRASVVSASQLFVVDSVPLGAIIYLSVLIYSPITCLFGFLGSLGGSLIAIQVGAPYKSIYSGLWGFNGYLTGASLGGSFFVMNGQVAAATCVAIALTGIMQHVLQIIFEPSGIPVGSIPFVLTTWLFIGLGKTPEGVFNYPITMSFPEAQRYEYLSQRRIQKLEKMCESTEPEVRLRNGKASLV